MSGLILFFAGAGLGVYAGVLLSRKIRNRDLMRWYEERNK